MTGLLYNAESLKRHVMLTARSNAQKMQSENVVLETVVIQWWYKCCDGQPQLLASHGLLQVRFPILSLPFVGPRLLFL